jgi:predicted membrane protein
MLCGVNSIFFKKLFNLLTDVYLKIIYNRIIVAITKKSILLNKIGKKEEIKKVNTTQEQHGIKRKKDN